MYTIISHNGFICVYTIRVRKHLRDFYDALSVFTKCMHIIDPCRTLQQATDVNCMCACVRYEKLKILCPKPGINYVPRQTPLQKVSGEKHYSVVVVKPCARFWCTDLLSSSVV